MGTGFCQVLEWEVLLVLLTNIEAKQTNTNEPIMTILRPYGSQRDIAIPPTIGPAVDPTANIIAIIEIAVARFPPEYESPSLAKDTV